jgi:SAM-dependent methyltransferase
MTKQFRYYFTIKKYLYHKGIFCYDRFMNIITNTLAWESEYQNPKFLSLGTEPSTTVKDFINWMKKDFRKNRSNPDQNFIIGSVLDLGCGNGKNLKYLVEQYADYGLGYDISETAIGHARELAGGLNIDYRVRSIGEKFPLRDESMDVILDITSSNSLNQQERNIFLHEVHRVLKPDGKFCSRMLCLDGDKNAKFLVQENPGPEYHTYILPEVGVIERVFTRGEIDEVYGKYFNILHIEKTTGYQRWDDRSFKRNYWVVYFGKK